MTLEASDLLRQLRSPRGAKLLERIAAAGDAGPSPAFLQGLRKEASRDLVDLAMKVARARRRAGAKFPRGEALFFTQDLLEQASAHPPALHRARRLAPLGPVLDLGCGAGGDLTRLAMSCEGVTGLEADPLALALAAANLEVLGLEAELRPGSFPECALPEFAALFCDPARRRPERGPSARRLAPAEFSPRPAHVADILSRSPAWALKWGPALDLSHEAISGPSGPLAGMRPEDYELELVSWAGELREAVFWGGRARQGHATQATVLHGPLDPFRTQVFRGDRSASDPAVRAPRAWILEPDPALIRSGLLGAYARERDLSLLAPRIAYLSGDAPADGLLARSWPLLEELPFSLSRLQSALDRHDAGDLILKKRGFPLDPEELRPRLKLGGSRRITVLIYRGSDERRVCVCGPEHGSLDPSA